jgi:hypothetical protein
VYEGEIGNRRNYMVADKKKPAAKKSAAKK